MLFLLWFCDGFFSTSSSSCVRHSFCIASNVIRNIGESKSLPRTRNANYWIIFSMLSIIRSNIFSKSTVLFSNFVAGRFQLACHIYRYAVFMSQMRLEGFWRIWFLNYHFMQWFAIRVIRSRLCGQSNGFQTASSQQHKSLFRRRRNATSFHGYFNLAKPIVAFESVTINSFITITLFAITNENWLTLNLKLSAILTQAHSILLTLWSLSVARRPRLYSVNLVKWRGVCVCVYVTAVASVSVWDECMHSV